jgi:hypothetical protein
MATSVSNLIETLRYTYGSSQVVYLMNEESVTWNILGKVKKPVGGRGQFILPILVKNAGAWTGIAEGGTLPTALAPDSAEALFSLVEFAGMIDVNWRLLQDSRSSKFSFQTAISVLQESFKRRIAKNINTDLIDNGLGRSGILSAADDQTTVTVRHLPRVDVGEVVDIIDASDDNTKIGDSRTVNAVNVETNEITISGAALSGTAAGDYFTIQDTVSTGVSRHLHGLLGVIDNADPPTNKGDFGGIDRATAGNEYWEATVLGNSGTNRPLTEDLLMRLEDGVRVKGGGKLNAYLSNHVILRRYHELVKQDVFFAMGKPSALDSGVGLGRDGMSPGQGNADGKSIYRFSGVPWHCDPYFDANRVVGMDKSHFFIGHGDNEVPRPESEVFEGRPFFRQATTASYEVAFYWQGELISDNPAAGGVIEDVSES